MYLDVFIMIGIHIKVKITYYMIYFTIFKTCSFIIILI
jgi:hypothetical protein